MNISHSTPLQPHAGLIDAFLTPCKSTALIDPGKKCRKLDKRLASAEQPPPNDTGEISKCAICMELGASWRPDITAQVFEPASAVQVAYHPYCILLPRFRISLGRR